MESRTAANKSAPYESPLLTALRHDRTSFFSQLPRDITHLISHPYYEFDTNSEIGIALQHAADARQEHVDALIAIVSAKPHLLLQRGRVITPGGNDVRGVTVYEYCLGAGDPELAKLIEPFFAEITGIDGEAERAAQYEQYKPYIDAMMTQEPYNLMPLIEKIKEAPAVDVTAMLKKDMAHECALRDAMKQFRNDHAPRIITKPCMHFNYRSLHHALDLVNREWNNSYLSSGNDYGKFCLVWRQLLGFEMRRLPGFDRCRLAQGLGFLNWMRTYKPSQDNVSEFPVTLTDDSLDGLGGNFAWNIHYGNEYAASGPWWTPVPSEGYHSFGRFMSSKTNSLTELMLRPIHPTGCVISRSSTD